MRKRLISALLVLLLFLSLAVTTLKAAAVTTNLRVGFNCGFPVYQYLNQEGEAEGLHIDLMDAIAKSQDFEIEYVPYRSDNECFEALDKGLIDVVLGVGADNYTDYDFQSTDTLSTISLCLIALNETAEKINEKNSTAGYLGVVEQGQSANIMSLQKSQNSSGFGNNTFIIARNQQDVLEKLISGEAEIAVCEKESALRQLEQDGISDRYTVVFNYLAQMEYTMLVRSDDARLLRMLNAGLSEVRTTGEYSGIIDKWLGSSGITISEGTIRTIIAAVVVVSCAVLLYVFLNLRMGRILRRKVAEQTHELRDVNQTLSESMDRLKDESKVRGRIIEDSPSGMVIIGKDRRILYMNRQAMKLAGLTGEAPLGDAVEQLPVFGELIGNYEPLQTSARPAVIKLGEGRRERSYRCTLYILPDEREAGRALLSVEDVTAEEQEKQEIFEAEKNQSLNTIIAGLAHEIKNPLTAIRTYSTLIPDQLGNEEFMASFSKFVPKETERINSLIESLINYARPSKGEVTKVELSELLSGCIGLIRSVARDAGADLQADLQSEVFMIGNRDQLRQALINYMMNALESVRQKRDLQGGGKSLVRITLRKENGKVFVSVYDEGVGMTEDERRRCMEPFFTTKSKGTGLGMAIALQAVRENNGTVTVESEKGKFTRITMEFEGCA